MTLQVLQFKTNQASDIRKVDELTSFLVSLMAGVDPAEVEAAAAADATATGGGQQRRSKRRN
jgi:hypothetical protein